MPPVLLTASAIRKSMRAKILPPNCAHPTSVPQGRTHHIPPGRQPGTAGAGAAPRRRNGSWR